LLVLAFARTTERVPDPRPAVISALGATPIDYTKGSFVKGIRELTGDGVDVVLDGIGGSVALGSYRALRRGGRLVMYGHYGITVGLRKSARKAALFYLTGALVFASNSSPMASGSGRYRKTGPHLRRRGRPARLARGRAMAHGCDTPRPVW